MDFTDLNKAFPKVPFPISWIDQLVDATVGYPRMRFLDGFQGYHEIVGKSGFVSHTKHTVEATNMDLFHS